MKPGRLNLNTLAREITLLEGKKQSISIAQVKEVLACVRQVLGARKTVPCSEILRWLGH